MAILPNFSTPANFSLITLLFFVAIVGRYFLIAGIFHLLFCLLAKGKWAKRSLSRKKPGRKQLYTEIKWSTITSMIFAIAGSFTAIFWQNGFTRLYVDMSTYPFWYLPVSLVLSLLIHESYYYWLHRWMHKPKVFRLLHKVHHDSNTTSAWTAFSFHPLEGLLQAIILPLTIVIIPMHVYVLLFQLTIMTFSSVINHLEIETYPANFHRHPVGKWVIGATHHSLHHKQFKYNFGLYFTFWDKWKKTESPTFTTLFEKKTAK